MEKKDSKKDGLLIEPSEEDIEFMNVLFFGSAEEVERFWDSSDDPFFKSTRNAMQRCLDEGLTGNAVIEAIQESVLDYYNQTKDVVSFAILKALNASKEDLQKDFEEENRERD